MAGTRRTSIPLHFSWHRVFIRSNNSPCFGTILVHHKKLGQSPSRNPLSRNNFNGVTCDLKSDHMLIQHASDRGNKSFSFKRTHILASTSPVRTAHLGGSAFLGKLLIFNSLESWRGRRDSNPRPHA